MTSMAPFLLTLATLFCAGCGGRETPPASHSTLPPSAMVNTSPAVTYRYFMRDQDVPVYGVPRAFVESGDSILVRVALPAPNLCCTGDDMACTRRDWAEAYLLRRETVDGWLWGVGDRYRFLIARCQGSCDTHHYLGIHALDPKSAVARSLWNLLQRRTDHPVFYTRNECSEAELENIRNPGAAFLEMQEEMERMQRLQQELDEGRIQ